MATLGSSASLTQTDYEDGTVFERTSSLFSPRPIRMKSATAFYAAFCPCFAEVECWPTGIGSAPVSVTSAVHDRMPVILDPDAYDVWLDPGMTNVAAASEMLKPYDARLMRCYPLSSRSTTLPTTMKNVLHLWKLRRFRIGCFRSGTERPRLSLGVRTASS